MDKYIVTIRTTIRKDFVFDANSELDAEVIAKDALTKVLKNGQIDFEVLNTKVVKKETKVLDTYNGHNGKLVEYINFLWNNARERMKPILYILIERDIEEFEEKCENCSILEAFEEDWEDVSFNYLNKVADNTDLENIIDFVRYNDKVRGKQLFSCGWV